MNIYDLLNEINYLNISHTDINYSEEQLKIANTLIENNNIIVDAVAGSGKTTTINCIIEKLYYKRILTILYSRYLTIETQSRIKRDNVDINTIHGFCQKEYGINCSDNNGIIQIIKDNMNYIGNSYDIIIIDEAQDLTPLLARVIIKIIHDTGAKSLVFLGDYKQCIFKFNNADERFLTEADKIFANNNKCIKYNNIYPWVRLKLSETYRCSTSIANFINKCVLNDDRLISNRECKGKPIYICANAFDINKDIYNLIRDYIDSGNEYDDIAILSYSIENDTGKETPVKKLVNILSLTYGIPIYKPNNDNRELTDEDLMKGKVVVSTFHQMKGRQRKMVILFGFDNGFYYYDDLDGNSNINEDENTILSENMNKNRKQNIDKLKCPNILYVAITRARDKLVIIQDSKKGCLPFINKKLIHEYADVRGIITENSNVDKYVADTDENIINENVKNLGLNIDNSVENVKTMCYSVTNLIKYLPDEIIEEFNKLYTVKTIHTVNHNIEISNKVVFDKYIEDVSSIYGSCIPLIKQYHLQNNFLVYESLKNLGDEASDLKIKNRYNKLIEEVENSQDKDNTIIKKLPYIINMHNCIFDRYIYPLNQIKNYNWFFEKNNLELIKYAVDKLCFLSNKDVFEKVIKYNDSIKLNNGKRINYTIIGSLDCVNDRYGPIEFKFVSVLSNYHKIQVVIYICIIYMLSKLNIKFSLYNIKTGEMLEVNLKDPKINAPLIINKIIKNKLERKSVVLNFDDLLNETYNTY